MPSGHSEFDLRFSSACRVVMEAAMTNGSVKRRIGRLRGWREFMRGWPFRTTLVVVRKVPPDCNSIHSRNEILLVVTWQDPARNWLADVLPFSLYSLQS